MLESKNMAAPDDKKTFEHGEIRLVNLSQFTVGRADLRPGWRWATDVSPLVGTDSCQGTHASYVVSGRLHVAMNDGRELELGPGDAHAVGPGHDAWVVGDEPCVTIDFIPAADAAGAQGGPGSVSAGVTEETAAVRSVIETYGEGLRRNDVAAVVGLFTDDAAVMAGGFPTAAGREQVTATYAAALASAAMDFRYEFDQVDVNGDTGVARTRSAGTTTMRASGEASTGRYRELFVLRRDEAGWRISAYMFQPQPAAS